MPKVFVFSPTGNSHEFLQANGCEVALGKDTWHQPGGNHEPEMIGMAQGAAALAGIEVLIDEGLVERSAVQGKKLNAGLTDVMLVPRDNPGPPPRV